MVDKRAIEGGLERDVVRSPHCNLNSLISASLVFANDDWRCEREAGVGRRRIVSVLPVCTQVYALLGLLVSYSVHLTSTCDLSYSECLRLAA